MNYPWKLIPPQIILWRLSRAKSCQARRPLSIATTPPIQQSHVVAIGEHKILYRCFLKIYHGPSLVQGSISLPASVIPRRFPAARQLAVGLVAHRFGSAVPGGVPGDDLRGLVRRTVVHQDQFPVCISLGQATVDGLRQIMGPIIHRQDN
jgi:hypothetical protein